MGWQQIGYWLWLAFVVSWNVAILWTGRVRSRGAPGVAIVYFTAYVVGFGLLFAMPFAGSAPFALGRLLPSRWLVALWTGAPGAQIALVALEGAAFAFAWWARVHLGRLWSGMLTLREGHRVVDSGPYRIVRHPIYTAFIVASWALALLTATATGLAGALVLTLVMTAKARTEEALLRRELGRGNYDDYARRTPMIVPFAPR